MGSPLDDGGCQSSRTRGTGEWKTKDSTYFSMLAQGKASVNRIATFHRGTILIKVRSESVVRQIQGKYNELGQRGS